MKMKYDPEWKKYEKDLHSEDADKARQAAVAFDETRKHELKNSAQAREWEQSRQESWRKDKHAWKLKQLQEEKAIQDKITKQLREGGHLMNGLKPRAGLLIVKVEKEEKQGEIYIPNGVQYLANTARVMRISDPVQSSTGNIVCPCNVGDLVLIRDGSGLDLKIKDEAMLLIRFDEVFGVVEE